MPPLFFTPALHRKSIPAHGKATQDRTGDTTARAKLEPRKASYFVRVAPHIALGYRRNHSGFGTWSVRFADGSASGWLKKFGTADDLEPADNKHVQLRSGVGAGAQAGAR